MQINHENLDSNSESGIEKISEIQEFFDGCNVLITGGSGFVGQLLIEKLLRSCYGIQKLYIILRGKKGNSSQERLKKLFAGPPFIRLRTEQPNFEDKVVLIEGGFDNNGLAISPDDRELIKNSHIVFHGAASVRFDDTLRFAVNINVRGTKEMCIFCKQMPNLKAFVFIGTAFSQCVVKFIDEIFYEPPIDGDKVLTLVDLLSEEQLEVLTPTLMNGWPNTYAFSKSIAENIVQKYSKELPVAIVRPSIMISTAKAPIPGWINNLYGVTGVIAGVATGVIHTLHCKSTNVADIIPADYVINNVVAAAWDIGTCGKAKSRALLSCQNDKKEDDEKIPIYNSVTSIQNPITWYQVAKYATQVGEAVPTMFTIWYYFFISIPNIWLYRLSILLLSFIPAVIFDASQLVRGRKPLLVKNFKKMIKFFNVISYFSMQQWEFRNDNVLKLWNKMSPVDRQIFYFHVGLFEWKQFFYCYIRGMRVYLMKDPMSTLDQAQKRFQKLKILHYIVTTMLFLLISWLIYGLFLKLYFIIFS